MLSFFTAPSSLETKLSLFITGGSVEVCVETQSAVLIKIILRDSNNSRYVSSGKCHTPLQNVPTIVAVLQ